MPDEVIDLMADKALGYLSKLGDFPYFVDSSSVVMASSSPFFFTFPP